MDKISTTDMSKADTVTVGVYATRAKLSRQTVVNRIYKGTIPAFIPVGQHWHRIPRAEYEKLPPLENRAAS